MENHIDLAPVRKISYTNRTGNRYGMQEKFLCIYTSEGDKDYEIDNCKRDIQKQRYLFK